MFGFISKEAKIDSRSVELILACYVALEQS